MAPWLVSCILHKRRMCIACYGVQTDLVDLEEGNVILEPREMLDMQTKCLQLRLMTWLSVQVKKSAYFKAILEKNETFQCSHTTYCPKPTLRAKHLLLDLLSTSLIVMNNWFMLLNWHDCCSELSSLMDWI